MAQHGVREICRDLCVLAFRDVKVPDQDLLRRAAQPDYRHAVPAQLIRGVARVLEMKLRLRARDHRANAVRGKRSVGAVGAGACARADAEVIQADGRWRGLCVVIAERELPPRFIHVADDPLLIEHRDGVGQGIEHRQTD